VKRHPLRADPEDLSIRPRGVPQSKSACRDLFCGNAQPQIGRYVETVKRHQNVRHRIEWLFKFHDVLEVPFPFAIFEVPEAVIVIGNSVIASLDVHWIRSLPGKCKSTAKPRETAFLQCRELVAVDALVLPDSKSRQGESV
jgi:hypothetical protein